MKNLIAVACADGVIEDTEMLILQESARDAGLNSDELDDLLKNALNYVPEIPEEKTERESHLIKMITLATSDGNFSQEEFELCKLIAEKMEYPGLSQVLKSTMNHHYLKNLVAIACADGVVEPSEMAILKEAAEDVGISESELEILIEHSDTFKHLIPESEEDREMQLAQMISLAIADGEFSIEEYNLCKVVAERLGFTEKELKMIIRLSFKGSSEIN